MKNSGLQTSELFNQTIMEEITIKQTIIRFPDIRLHTSAAHKLRGYVATLAKENAHFFHNHDDDGNEIYRYPRIQYKIVDEVPCLIGFLEGADLLVNLFLNLRELALGNEVIPVHSKTLKQTMVQPGVNNELYSYGFKTLWMGLNQKNYRQFLDIPESEKNRFLDRCLVNNILSFYKGIGVTVQHQILAKASLLPHSTTFKNQPILVFSGSFTTNAWLPDLAGIGKSVSRGFGTVKMLK